MKRGKLTIDERNVIKGVGLRKGEDIFVDTMGRVSTKVEGDRERI